MRIRPRWRNITRLATVLVTLLAVRVGLSTIPPNGAGPLPVAAWLIVFLAAIAAPNALLWYLLRRYPPGHCPRCGYDLIGNTTGICPECGTGIP